MRKLFCYVSLAVFLLTVASTQQVKADGCHVVGVRSNYVATTYNHNYSATPTFHHNYNNYAVTPYAVPFVQIPATFYSVAPEIAQARINQVTAEEAADRALEKFLSKLQAETSKNATAQRSTYNTSVKQQSVDRDPLAGMPISTGPTNDIGGSGIGVAAIFQTRCVKCHGAGSELDLTQPAKLTREVRELIEASISHDEDVKAMPPKQAKIPLAEIRVIRRWAKEEIGS